MKIKMDKRKDFQFDYIKMLDFWVAENQNQNQNETQKIPTVAQHLRDLIQFHNDSGSTAGFAQWVKYLALPQAVM